MTTNSIVPSQMDDQSLLDSAVRLALEERRATAALLRALMEIDSRRLYLGQGCASMFTYCVQVLHLSEGAAYNRIEASRAAKRYPVILLLLEQSALTLTAVRLLAPHLTDDNQALFRHALPSGDAAEIFDRALRLLVADLERRKAAQVKHPRRSAPCAATSRQIPAIVRREVWTRDNGRCAFVGSHGRCHETGMLEFHHVQPFAAGGPATTENIQLRCRAHNAYEASLFFGEDAAGVREAGPSWG